MNNQIKPILYEIQNMTKIYNLMNISTKISLFINGKGALDNGYLVNLDNGS
jgi:hypothetical protein